MDFVDTFDSLKNFLVNKRLSKSLEKAVSVNKYSGVFTVDPNESNMFLINVVTNSTVALSALDSEYTSTGSVISILMTLSNANWVITWPNSIKWQDETAPELTHKNLITLMHFGETDTWYGGCIAIDDDFS